MKILYAIQGTGNGHITRALHIVPKLKKVADVDVLISGYQSEIELPFKVNFKYSGLSFVFGKSGGIDYISTYKKSRLKRFYREIKSLDVSQYDIVISDFEPISAWACYKAKKLCIGLSNQATLLTKNVPKPKSLDVIGKLILKNYAPTPIKIGFHYEKYNSTIFSPIIRDEIRKGKVSDNKTYLVYLPSYSDAKIEKVLSQIKKVKWIVYSKQCEKPFELNNFQFKPINQKNFNEDFLSCSGIISAAGFATTSEALHLGKKLLVIPQKGQLEQQFNKTALKKLRVKSVKSLKKKHVPVIEDWIKNGTAVVMNYQDETDKIINYILKNYSAWEEEKMNKFFKKVKTPNVLELQQEV